MTPQAYQRQPNISGHFAVCIVTAHLPPYQTPVKKSKSSSTVTCPSSMLSRMSSVTLNTAAAVNEIQIETQSASHCNEFVSPFAKPSTPQKPLTNKQED
jgi:hypothetical protein